MAGGSCWGQNINDISQRNYGDYDYCFNIITVGMYGVGKTSLSLRFSDGTFDESSIPGVLHPFLSYFKVKPFELDGKLIKLHIWDTFQMERRYRSLPGGYFAKCHGAIFVYDIAKSSSFECLPYWMDKMNDYGSLDVPILVIGNKTDLESQRQVSIETAQNYANSMGIPYIETSAKDNTNVEQMFLILTELIMKKVRSNCSDGLSSDALSIQ